MQRLLPAYPIFLKDPYFSFWAESEDFARAPTVFWQGDPKPLYGGVTADGRRYVFLGGGEGEPLTQTGLEISALGTKAVYRCPDFDLTVEFLSPLPLDDLKLTAMPVCYLVYTLVPRLDLGSVAVWLSAGEEVCYNPSNPDKRVRGDVMRVDGFECAYIGLDRQQLFSASADNVAADWGYWYAAGRSCRFDNDGKARVTASDEFTGRAGVPAEGKLLFAFDERAAVSYYGDVLKGLYFADGGTIVDALLDGYHGFDRVRAACAAFEKRFSEAVAPFGEAYRLLAAAAYRQAVAGHKLTRDLRGRLLFLSKECSSDGCIATVDVSYASAPLFLWLRPSLVQGMLTPIFDFARMPVWGEEFAPHDAGVYPYCNGQFYAVANSPEGKYRRAVTYIDERGEGVLPAYYLYPPGCGLYDYDRQMPVEECSNMLILTALSASAAGDYGQAAENFDLLTLWADYLVRKGFIPDKQLCTDDFAGHLDKNVNLSVKATIALRAYADTAAALGREGGRYAEVARERADELVKRFPSGTPLSFDDPPGETFSVKYNLAADLMLKSGLFPADFLERETDAYAARTERFGCPLDSRGADAKSDWLVWAAALTRDEEKRKRLIGPIADFLKESPPRVPFSDWYDASTGAVPMFRNRTVQGGLFILPLLYGEKNRKEDRKS